MSEVLAVEATLYRRAVGGGMMSTINARLYPLGVACRDPRSLDLQGAMWTRLVRRWASKHSAGAAPRGRA